MSTAEQYCPESRVGSGELQRLLAAIQNDAIGDHEVCPSPEDAEIILFVDSARPDMRDIRGSSVFRRFRDKSFVLHCGDRVMPFVPGLFTSAERATHSPRRSRTGGYLRMAFSHHFHHTPVNGAHRFLFSFVGRSETAPVRRALVQLQHRRGLVLDTSAPGTSLAIDAYARVIQESAFVLCPRGFGSSSFRLFEAMKTGRAPVILADDWIPPVGPEWDRFAIIVPESDVTSLPQLLEAREAESVNMGELARDAWETWFGKSVVFQSTVDWILDLQRDRLLPESVDGVLFQVGRLTPASLYRHWTQRDWRRKFGAMP
ncbi:exostosin domain-containing protein [Thiocapsa roseopersicina]|uniref:exostosin domain-containing protein n=1 Tax=Thiocapsa roseopersicina TaxID=1058 RepID=UPI001C31243C|nr:exostosin family protein [Thiocapsa roseopersicina]